MGERERRRQQAKHRGEKDSKRVEKAEITVGGVSFEQSLGLPAETQSGPTHNRRQCEL